MKSQCTASFRSLAIAMLLIGAATAAGCETEVRRPIATSLQNLQLDVAPIKGPVFRHNEVFSIAGLIPTPDVGYVMHYPAEDRSWFNKQTMPPSTAIGISDHRSHKLVGTVGANVSDTQVNNVLKLALKVRKAAAALIAADVKRASSAALLSKENQALDLNRKTLEELQSKHKNLLSSQNSSASSEKVSAAQKELTEARNAINESEIKVASTRSQLMSDEQKKVGLRAALDTAITELHESATTPGIIIANWAVEESSEFEVKAEEVAGARFENEKIRDGLVILGGLRVSHLYIGDDFKDLYLNLQREDRLAFQHAGLVTYTLQAKHVRYLSTLDLTQLVRAQAEIRKSDLVAPEAILARIDSVSISAAYEAAAALSSVGSASGMAWRSEAIELGTDPSHAADGDSIDAFVNENEWSTVQTVVTTPDRLARLWKGTLGSHRDIEMPLLLEQNFKGCGGVDCVNEELGRIRGELLTDRSYLGKDQLRSHFSCLASSIGRLNRDWPVEKHCHDDDALRRVAAHLKHVNATTDPTNGSFGWSGIKARSKQMATLIQHLHGATREIEKITNRRMRRRSR